MVFLEYVINSCCLEIVILNIADKRINPICRNLVHWFAWHCCGREAVPVCYTAAISENGNDTEEIRHNMKGAGVDMGCKAACRGSTSRGKAKAFACPHIRFFQQEAQKGSSSAIWSNSKHENQNPSLMKFQCYEIYESNRLITLQRSNKVTLKNRYLFVESYIFHNAERDFPLCLIFCFCFFMLTKMLLLQNILPFFDGPVFLFLFDIFFPLQSLTTYR